MDTGHGTQGHNQTWDNQAWARVHASMCDFTGTTKSQTRGHNGMGTKEHRDGMRHG